MKISEFAKKFDTSKSTIRYFTDIGLLIPSTKGTYPDYDHKCEIDMNDILEYKNMGFSNSEIGEIKYFERFFINKNAKYNERVKTLFEDKITELELLIKKQKSYIKAIRRKSSSLKEVDAVEFKGISTEVLNDLLCSNCGDSFNIVNASLKGMHLISGNLECSCGIKYVVTDGILHSSDIQLGSFEIPPESLDIDFSGNTDTKLLSTLLKCGASLSTELQNTDHSKGIVFSNTNINLFLMDVLKNFKDNGKYFFCMTAQPLLNIAKYIIEREQPKGLITLILCKDNFPIDGSQKCFLDVFSIQQDSEMKIPPGTLSSSFNYGENSSALVFNISVPNFSDPFPEGVKVGMCESIYSSYGFEIDKNELISSLPILFNNSPRDDLMYDIYFKTFIK